MFHTQINGTIVVVSENWTFKANVDFRGSVPLISFSLRFALFPSHILPEEGGPQKRAWLGASQRRGCLGAPKSLNAPLPIADPQGVYTYPKKCIVKAEPPALVCAILYGNWSVQNRPCCNINPTVWDVIATLSKGFEVWKIMKNIDKNNIWHMNTGFEWSRFNSIFYFDL